jgi:hypothetical protein
MKTLRFVFLVLIVCITVLGAAQNTGSEPGAIQGTITRAGKGEPLEGATVTLQGGNADPQAIQSLLTTAASQGIVVTPARGATTRDIVQSLANEAQARGVGLTVANIQSQLASLSGRTPPTTTTDRDGRFAFRDIAPGFYTVRVQKEGFFGKPESGTFPPTAAIDVSVAAKEVKDASIAMTPGALIGGRVYGVDGQLVSNAIVWSMRVTYPLGYAVLSGQVSKGSDDRGEFRVFWVPPGDYYLTAEAPRAAPTPGGGPAGQGIKTFYPGTTDVTEARVITVKGGRDLRHGHRDTASQVLQSLRTSLESHSTTGCTRRCRCECRRTGTAWSRCDISRRHETSRYRSFGSYDRKIRSRQHSSRNV